MSLVHLALAFGWLEHFKTILTYKMKGCFCKQNAIPSFSCTADHSTSYCIEVWRKYESSISCYMPTNALHSFQNKHHYVEMTISVWSNLLNWINWINWKIIGPTLRTRHDLQCLKYTHAKYARQSTLEVCNFMLFEISFLPLKTEMRLSAIN